MRLRNLTAMAILSAGLLASGTQAFARDHDRDDWNRDRDHRYERRWDREKDYRREWKEQRRDWDRDRYYRDRDRSYRDQRYYNNYYYSSPYSYQPYAPGISGYFYYSR